MQLVWMAVELLYDLQKYTIPPRKYTFKIHLSPHGTGMKEQGAAHPRTIWQKLRSIGRL